MKRHSDSVWYVKPLIVKEGHKAPVKRDESKKKSDMSYNTTPSIEFDKRGSIVTTKAHNAN